MSPYDPRYLQFFDLFNQGDFFEAHEVLELLWRQTENEDRDFYQGLIQLAAAFVHKQKNNPQGFETLYQTASRYLANYPDRYQGILISSLLQDVRKALDKPPGFSPVLTSKIQLFLR